MSEKVHIKTVMQENRAVVFFSILVHYSYATELLESVRETIRKHFWIFA